MEKEFQRILSSILSLTNKIDSEDLAQEIIVIQWREERIVGRNEIQNRVIDRIRQEDSRKRAEGVNFEEAQERKKLEFREEIAELIRDSDLSLFERQILYKTFWAGKGLKEIAKDFGVGERMIGETLRNSIRKLRR